MGRYQELPLLPWFRLYRASQIKDRFCHESLDGSYGSELNAMVYLIALICPSIQLQHLKT